MSISISIALNETPVYTARWPQIPS